MTCVLLLVQAGAQHFSNTLSKGIFVKKNYIARRRGTSVAAAALSFALVMPFAQTVVNPTAVPEAFAQVADADSGHVYIGGGNTPGITQPTLVSGGADDAGVDIYDIDAIASVQIDNLSLIHISEPTRPY